jgi:spore coat polysaccharide biosynthesis protein SpsF (cytidylyltransferase family)
MIGIFITARLGSKRLHEKHLIEVGNLTFIEWLILRYEYVFKSEILTKKVKLFLTTSNKVENLKFNEILSKYSIEIFFGDDMNIPKRYSDCAKKNNIDFFIVVDGDDILCSPVGSYKLFQSISENNNYDIYKIVGFPIGLNSSAYKLSYFVECLDKNKNSNLEIGWSRIFKDPLVKEIILGEYDIHSHLRFTLDYIDDAKFFKSIINYLGKKILYISDYELIDLVIKQEYYKINSYLSKEYWENYNKSIQQENLSNG